MSTFLWIGTGLGAFFGFLHGAYLYRQQIAVRDRARGFIMVFGPSSYGLFLALTFSCFGFLVSSAIRSFDLRRAADGPLDPQKVSIYP